jgi:hypothetical protein
MRQWASMPRHDPDSSRWIAYRSEGRVPVAHRRAVDLLETFDQIVAGEQNSSLEARQVAPVYVGSVG